MAKWHPSIRHRNPFIKREVAIKVLAYELTQDSLFLDFFYQEAEAIASLEHPTIVPIYRWSARHSAVHCDALHAQWLAESTSSGAASTARSCAT